LANANVVGQGKEIRTFSLTHIVNGIYKHGGISGATSHSVRRTGLTNLAERGVGVRVLMALAGHSNMATTQR